MCWNSPDELYNDGGAFKITCRDHQGVIVTLIADNYFGYCKKEVKTQLSYAANLLGLAEEEHAGGALAFPAFDLGEIFQLSHHRQIVDHQFDKVAERFGDRFDLQPEGYGIDKLYPDIVYVPENVHIDLHKQRVSWIRNGQEHEIRLQPGGLCTAVWLQGRDGEAVRRTTMAVGRNQCGGHPLSQTVYPFPGEANRRVFQVPGRTRCRPAPFWFGSSPTTSAWLKM